MDTDRIDMDTDRITYCDIYECCDCPRCGDDCDGKGEECGIS